MRRAATREKHSYTDDQGLDRLAADGCVVEFVIQTERARTLRKAMPALPDKQRTVIEPAFDAGLSHTEIAHHAALPLGTVKSRVRIALATLRQALPADMAEP